MRSCMNAYIYRHLVQAFLAWGGRMKNLWKNDADEQTRLNRWGGGLMPAPRRFHLSTPMAQAAPEPAAPYLRVRFGHSILRCTDSGARASRSDEEGLGVSPA
jgi:hypothetical protein